MTSQTQNLTVTDVTATHITNVISFNYLDTANVKVKAGTTAANRQDVASTKYVITADNKIQFNANAFDATGTYSIKIFRQTNGSALRSVFQPGATIKASDLNEANQQALYLAEENRDSINSLAAGDASGAILISGSNIADNSITTDKILDLQVKTDDIDNLAVTTGKIANLNVTTAKLANSTGTSDGVTTAKIADGAVTEAKINSAVIFTPVGTVITFAGDKPPVGYLKCNGDSINNGNTAISGNFINNTAIGTIDTSALYAIVGGTLPDLRGEFIRGWADDTSEIARDKDRLIRTSQTDQNKQHNHSIDVTGTTDNKELIGEVGKISETYAAHGTATGICEKLSSQDAGKTPASTDTTGCGRFKIDASHDHAFTANGTSGNQGGTESRPRNVALLMCIKY